MKFDIGDRVFTHFGTMTIVGYVYYSATLYYCCMYNTSGNVHDILHTHVHHKVEEAA